jgi:hypothetical protein
VVTKLYQDFLGRGTDPTGLQFWAQWLADGSGQAALVRALTSSVEYVSLRVDLAYTDVLHRAPDPVGKAFWVQRILAGLNTVDDVKIDFYLSNEFYGQGGGTDAGYIQHMYDVMLGRSATPAEVSAWTAVIASQGRDVATRGVWFSYEAGALRTAKYYSTFLNRGPDPVGLNGWTNILLAQGEGAVRTGIAGSDEYRALATAMYPNA